MNKFKDYIRRRFMASRRLRQARRRSEIEARFQVTERGGQLYILCLGTAVARLEDETRADDVVVALNAARAAAIEFSETDQLND